MRPGQSEHSDILTTVISSSGEPMTRIEPIRAVEIQSWAFARAISTKLPFAGVTKLNIKLELQGVPECL